MPATISAARILSQRSHLVPGKLKITEHFFQVPRDYRNPSLGDIQLFARSAEKAPSSSSSSNTPKPSSNSDQKQQPPPWLLYLQGGPGFECRPPQNAPFTSFLLEKGYRVLFLDQRGTGLSTAISQSSLQLRGDEAVQTEYMKSFRADSIVKDCEAVRLALMMRREEGQHECVEEPQDPAIEEEGEAVVEVEEEKEERKWSILGQSFGGFCCVTYLSLFPGSLSEVFLTGGLPPLIEDASASPTAKERRGGEPADGAESVPDKVYTHLYHRVLNRNIAYYEKFPEDIRSVNRILKFLLRSGDTAVRVQGGEGHITARSFLQLGLLFGKHGGIDSVHELVQRANNDLDLFGHLTRPTVMAIEAAQSWDSNVIYALLHESIYCSGPGVESDWAAERVMKKKFPQFDVENEEARAKIGWTYPPPFTGEMIYPFMFDCYPELKKLKEVGERLAHERNWPALYDLEKLKTNKVPVYAAVYYNDMYVDFDLSMQTAAKIKGCRTFVTNAMYHNAIGAKTEEVLGKLFEMRDDVID